MKEEITKRLLQICREGPYSGGHASVLDEIIKQLITDGIMHEPDFLAFVLATMHEDDRDWSSIPAVVRSQMISRALCCLSMGVYIERTHAAAELTTVQ